VLHLPSAIAVRAMTAAALPDKVMRHPRGESGAADGMPSAFAPPACIRSDDFPDKRISGKTGYIALPCQVGRSFLEFKIKTPSGG
jgi:hypothetical protein